MNRPTHAEWDPIIGEMFHELGREPIASTYAGGVQLASIICGRIVRGAMRPYDGASLIWRRIYYALKEPTELVVFVGLASEWEDCPQCREKHERDIIAAARQFLTAHAASGSQAGRD